MSGEYYLPSFYFRVAFSGVLGSSVPSDNSFLDVSGIKAEVDTEEYQSGGENRFVHSRPKGI